MFATVTIEKYQKKSGTKTVYELVSTETDQVDETYYKNVVESSPFFRRLGGSEYHERSCTSKGYLTTKIISKRPCRL